MAKHGDILCCPRCGGGLDTSAQDRITCGNSECRYSKQGFPRVKGKPVLIDFENSIFDEEQFTKRAAPSTISRDDRSRLKSRIKWLFFGKNSAAAGNCERMIALAKEIAPSPRILVIGGGVVGSGAQNLYRDPNLEIIGTDIYDTDLVDLLVDGHHLPFRDGSIDAVWIQAVLEHVLDPWAVVAEIHRVLKTNGLVYADTPFMQQVHEGAFDFTRFTVSGHRWLFKNFDMLACGSSGGPGVALRWSIRYFVRGLFRSNQIGTAISLPFFWLRYLDRFMPRIHVNDASSGVYFLGRKAPQTLSPKHMFEFYRDQSLPHGTT